MIEYFDSKDDNEWMDTIASSTMMDLIDNQRDFLYMSGELGPGRKPKLKDDAWNYIYDKVCDELGDFINCIVVNIMEKYHKSDIDFPANVAEDYNWFNNLSEGDEGYITPIDDKNPSEEE